VVRPLSAESGYLSDSSVVTYQTSTVILEDPIHMQTDQVKVKNEAFDEKDNQRPHFFELREAEIKRELLMREQEQEGDQKG